MHNRKNFLTSWMFVGKPITLSYAHCKIFKPSKSFAGKPMCKFYGAWLALLTNFGLG
jgi:hypothetical protein